MKYSFTVIIPHKNIPSLLHRCLDSIPCREDLQVIIVDDNSDSNKVNFETFPGLNRSHCRVIFTKDGKGAGYARNVALREADSKWVLFADADDYYSENLNNFLDKYKDTDYQTVYFCNNTVDNDTLKPVDKDKFVASLIKECEQQDDMGLLRYKAYAPWTKMTQLNFIRKYNIEFEEIPAANDCFFNVKVGHYAQNFAVYKDSIYVRTVRQGSLFYSLKGDLLVSRIKCGYRVNDFLRSVGKIHDYHIETWSWFLDLRKISWWLFIKNIPEYFVRTPWFVLKQHLYYLIKRKKR